MRGKGQRLLRVNRAGLARRGDFRSTPDSGHRAAMRKLTGRATSGPGWQCPISGEYLTAAADCGGRASIELAKGRVETTHTAKTSPISNLGQRFIRLVNQPLRSLYTPGFCDLLRAGANVQLEKARKVARADPKPVGEGRNRTAIQRSTIDQFQGASDG